MDRTSSIDISRADPARRYNAWLGGKDNFAADRASAQSLKEALPSIELAAQENRKFVRRAVHYLAAEHGIRQFLDIGVGFPDVPNVHEVAQAVDPTSRVVYVDHNPYVAVHARALLVSTPGDASEFLHADLLAPEEILTSDVLRDTLDLGEPVALVLAAVLHFCTDEDDPYTAVRTLVDALPAGSYVVLSHATFDPLDDDMREQLAALAQPDAGHGPFQPRTRHQVATFLDGLDVVEPGLVSTIRWQPDRKPTAAAHRDEREAVCYAAVARVP
jgi:hypothetical protein